MKKSSGVRLQQLPRSPLPSLQCCLFCSDRLVLNFSNLFVFLSPALPFLFHFLPLSLLLVFLLSIFGPDVCPFSFLSHLFPLCLFTCSLSSTSFSLLFPRGLPVWYSACVARRQDGLEHGQAPQTTLIHRTAFQSLLQCCSTYINTTRGREPRIKRGKKVKIIERDKNKQGQM